MKKLEICNKNIITIKSDIESADIELDRLCKEKKTHLSKNIKSAIGCLICLSLTVLTVLAIFYEPFRSAVISFLQIDVNKMAINQLDFWKAIGAYLVVCIIAAVVAGISDGDIKDAFAAVFGIGAITIGTLMLPITILLTFPRGDKNLKKKFAAACKKRNALDGQLEQFLKEKEELECIKAQAEEIYNKAAAENDLEMIKKAADMGLIVAQKYLRNKEKEEKLRQAEIYYQQAKKSEPTDRELLKKAADLGDKYASFEYAEVLVADAASPLYTKREKSDFCKQAERYLRTAKENGNNSDDLECLLIHCIIENNVKEDCRELLYRARKIKNNGKLTGIYASKMADDLIECLVNKVNSLDNSYTPLPTVEIDDPVAFMERVHNSMYGRTPKPLSDDWDWITPHIDVSDM